MKPIAAGVFDLGEIEGPIRKGDSDPLILNRDAFRGNTLIPVAKFLKSVEFYFISSFSYTHSLLRAFSKSLETVTNNTKVKSMIERVNCFLVVLCNSFLRSQ